MTISLSGSGGVTPVIMQLPRTLTLVSFTTSNDTSTYTFSFDSYYKLTNIVSIMTLQPLHYSNGSLALYNGGYYWNHSHTNNEATTQYEQQEFKPRGFIFGDKDSPIYQCLASGGASQQVTFWFDSNIYDAMNYQQTTKIYDDSYLSQLINWITNYGRSGNEYA